MKRVLTPRQPANFPDSVRQQLNSYALAAGAAGVGALALAQPAQAKIVYTATNQQLLRNQPLNIDINHDGIADFAVESFGYRYSGSGHVLSASALAVKGIQESNAVRTEGTKGFAGALRSGAVVGAGKRFSGGWRYMAECDFSATINGHTSQRSAGPWLNTKQRYLGLKFTIGGEVHYGWARLAHRPTTFSCHGQGLAGTFLTGYAYESIAGKAIIAGKTKGPDDEPTPASIKTPTRQPATVGVLALGAPGLSIWRRESVGIAPCATGS